LVAGQKRALEALPISWDEAGSKELSSEKIKDAFLKGLEAEDVAIGRKDGDVDTALTSAHSVVSADYEVPYLAHITMEPQTCTAHVTEGGVEVWAPTQNGEGTLRVVAKTLGIDPSRVTVHSAILAADSVDAGLHRIGRVLRFLSQSRSINP
jgi:isoquinoline 1-oxidoreductase subunit beta